MKNYGLIFLGLLVFACAPSDDFGVPQAIGVEGIPVEASIDLDAVLGAYWQVAEEMGVVTFEEEKFMEAYVVSSDQAGNFYKELILQNAPENPTAGLAVQLNLPSYYGSFDFGRKIYVNLQGLSVGALNGVPALGVAKGNTIEQIPLSRIDHHLLRSAEVAEIVPLRLSALEFNRRKLNLFIELQKFQVAPFHLPQERIATFASEDNDEFDGERQLVSCTGDFPVILSTSTFADFKALKLPTGAGNLKGILTRDFYDDFFTVYLNSPEDLAFDEEERCDLPSLNCPPDAGLGGRVLFEEDFEGGKSNAPVTGNGWTNYIEEGSVAWERFSASGANSSLGTSARVQIAGSGDYKSVSWLITPAIEFNSASRESLEFKSSTSFANFSRLEVFFSNDWDGTEDNVGSATWKLLSAARIAERSDYFGDWIPSGKLGLDCAEGRGYIGFRFTGSDTEFYNGIYELDEIRVTAQ